MVTPTRTRVRDSPQYTEGMTTWRPDVLGDGYENLTLPLGTDDEGEVVATLVRSLPTPRTWWQRLTREPLPFSNVDVLYVHGWSDYFFQTNLAQFWTDRGARFFALDLRKYGRSYREGQTHGYVADLSEYQQDIDAALEIIGRSDDRKRILLGHSTGGLVLSLWAAEHPDGVDAVILNSPWLEFQFSGAIRRVIATILDLSVRVNPLESAPQLDFGYYNRAQREIGGGRSLPVNLDWRPERSMPIRAGWLHAILAGHDRVEAGLNLKIPVCVLLSSQSVSPVKWSEEMLRADSVLNVDDIAKAATRIGESVTIERIDGALHDVFISEAAATLDAFQRMERWMNGFLNFGTR